MLLELDESLDEAELDPLEDPELEDPEELDDSEELEELDDPEPEWELEEDPVVGGAAIDTFSVALNPEPVAKHKSPISANRIRILF